MSNVGTIEIERVLPGFRPTRSRHYTGRHRAERPSPVLIRAGRRIAHEWNKPRAWTTAIGTRIAWSINDEHAERVYDLLTGETLRTVSHRIARAWRILDQAAYARIPKTWRHRLEQRANTRRQIDDQQRNTEAWWALRSADYPVLIPTQPLPTLEKTQ